MQLKSCSYTDCNFRGLNYQVKIHQKRYHYKTTICKVCKKDFPKNEIKEHRKTHSRLRLRLRSSMKKESSVEKPSRQIIPPSSNSESLLPASSNPKSPISSNEGNDNKDIHSFTLASGGLFYWLGYGKTYKSTWWNPYEAHFVNLTISGELDGGISMKNIVSRTEKVVLRGITPNFTVDLKDMRFKCTRFSVYHGEMFRSKYIDETDDDIDAMVSTYKTSVMKKFDFSGSFDGSSWDILARFDEPITRSSTNNIFEAASLHFYRFYRLRQHSNTSKTNVMCTSRFEMYGDLIQ